MKRYYCMLLIFTACLIVAGCRRSGAGTPREPVPVKKEIDILPVPREGTLLFEGRPLDRRYRLYIESIRRVEKELEKAEEGEKKARWRSLAASQELMEKNDQDGASKARERQDKEDVAMEFDEFAKICHLYLQ